MTKTKKSFVKYSFHKFCKKGWSQLKDSFSFFLKKILYYGFFQKSKTFHVNLFFFLQSVSVHGCLTCFLMMDWKPKSILPSYKVGLMAQQLVWVRSKSNRISAILKQLPSGSSKPVVPKDGVDVPLWVLKHQGVVLKRFSELMNEWYSCCCLLCKLLKKSV